MNVEYNVGNYDNPPMRESDFINAERARIYGAAFDDNPSSSFDHDKDTTKFLYNTKSIKKQFIRKVFILVFLQLIFACGLVALFVFQPDCRRFIQRNLWFYILSCVLFLASYIAIACSTERRRQYPGNLICLLLLTVSLSFMVANIASYHSVTEIVVALLMATLACFLIIIYSIQPWYDFTLCVAVASGAFTTLLAFSIISLFTVFLFNMSILFTVYSGIGVLLLMTWLSIDVYLMVNGDRSGIDAEDYVFAAAQLFVDIVYVFMILLSCAGRCGR